MSEGAWIFLSHSHKDFDKVRDLRNELEVLKHHPLMFFLKCLDDDSAIDALIRKEIEARSWFVLCDSANSRASRWVQEERKIIAGLPAHTYTSAIVDLTAPLAAQLASIHRLTRRASVFLSYALADAQYARQIEASLRADDFGVFSDLQIEAGASWARKIEAALNDAVDQGAVLLLISRASLRSQWQEREIVLALERMERRPGRRNIVPLFLEPSALVLREATERIRDGVGRIQGFDFSSGKFEETMVAVKQWLRRFEWQP